MKLEAIIKVLEDFAPLSIQEEWDNSGLQCGHGDTEISGALLCVDVTERVVQEAVERGCNLIISHHPLLFKPLSQVVGANSAQRTLEAALKSGVAIYSAHTSLDSAYGGISWKLAENLGLKNVSVLVPHSAVGNCGLGVVGDLIPAVTVEEFLERVKSALGSCRVRVSDFNTTTQVGRIALCGGSGAEFIKNAISAGAQVLVTGDCRHNNFIDYKDDIVLVDAGHFETEECAKEILKDLFSEKMPNFAVHYSKSEKNPVVCF